MTPPAPAEKFVDLPHGARVAYGEYGSPEGMPLIYCHGFPASQAEASLIDDTGKDLGIRIIAPDRPGTGGSSFVADRRLLDWPKDVAGLADALGIERFILLGVSGGCPYSLACAHEIPDRIRSMGIVCGLGPVFLPEARRAMRWPGRLGFSLALSAPWLLHVFYGSVSGWMLRRWPEMVLLLLIGSCPPADREVLEERSVRRALRLGALGALREGTRGIRQELHTYAHPWGFELSSVRRPIRMWHGDLDATVPLAHGQMLARALPGATLTVLKGEGHFSLPVRHREMMLRALLEDAAGAR